MQGLQNVELTTVDISSPQSVEQWAAEVAQLAPHADVVINNAGIYGRRVGLDDVTADDMLYAVGGWVGGCAHATCLGAPRAPGWGSCWATGDVLSDLTGIKEAGHVLWGVM